MFSLISYSDKQATLIKSHFAINRRCTSEGLNPTPWRSQNLPPVRSSEVAQSPPLLSDVLSYSDSHATLIKSHFAIKRRCTLMDTTRHPSDRKKCIPRYLTTSHSNAFNLTPLRSQHDIVTAIKRSRTLRHSSRHPCDHKNTASRVSLCAGVHR
jgi:hypothetical protein